MISSAVAELEHLLASPPPNILQSIQSPTNNAVAVAHAVLEAIREAGDENCLFLRCIVELLLIAHQQQRAGSSTPVANIAPGKEELFFHCVTGWRQVVLWNWKRFSCRFRRIMRDYFMVLGHELSPASQGSVAVRTCRLACYTSAVAFWKRGWTEEEDEQRRDSGTLNPMEESLWKIMLTVLPNPTAFVELSSRADLSRYLESAFQQEPEKAAAFAQILVGEFSGKSAISYRLPLEFHKECHRSFEKTVLFPILQLSMKALEQVLSDLSNGVDPANTFLLVKSQEITQLNIDAIGWEFGITAFDSGNVGTFSTVRTLIRPPYEWKQVLAQPDLPRAVFHIHHMIALASVRSPESSVAKLAQNLRQLLLQLASLSGPIFATPAERIQFASHLTDGALQLLDWCQQSLPNMVDGPDLLDTLQLISRIISNFRLATMVELSSTMTLLEGVASIASTILSDQVRECEQEGGDLDSMEHREWREEAMALLLDCAVLLCGDPWILYSGSEDSRLHAQQSLSTVLGPLYEGFVRCRTKMAAMEEYRLVSESADLDDVKEDIAENDLEEEISLVSVVGRLNLSAAIACLSTLFGNVIPSLQALWDGSGEVTPTAASLLEESRLLTMYVCQLLTDDNKGEAPVIPDAVIIACQRNASLTREISAAVHAVIGFAESQVRKITSNPSNRRLSPMLAKSFLWFLNRWAPAYVYPTDYGGSNASNSIVHEWSSTEKAQQVVTFCVSLCLHYQCYWPHESQVQQSAGQLLLSLASRKGEIRSAMVASSSFHQVVRFHCLTAGVRHSATHEEFNVVMRAKVGTNHSPEMDMVWGYQRLPYQDKSRILTAILVTCSDPSDQVALSLLSESRKALHDSFTSYMNAISSKSIVPEDVNAKEMACLCVELFCGVANASEMSDAQRIPMFLTPYLSQLASLMAFYSDDLTIAEALLRFFRDYATNFIVALDREQSLSLFHAAADMLKNYSSNHCEKRIVRSRSAVEVEAEEEQEYSDILCAIQLLINLSAKDFIDACNSEQSIDTSQVTDMIFYGLQQIIPLMSQGLLQFPALCQQFFDLVGFMMDTYPEKVCALPYELFNSLLDSLLFGMSHHSLAVANCSLHGLASIAKEHLEKQVLQSHLIQHPDIVDRISRRLLTEVVFQSVVVDRVEAAGMAILPLAAVDVYRFANVVGELTAQVPNEQQRVRLQHAFSTLIQPDALAKVSEGGYEGRMNRARFKKAFQEFVNEVHAFLVLR